MRRSYEDYHVLEEVGFVETLENIGVALERACDVLEKLLAADSLEKADGVAKKQDCEECRCGAPDVPAHVPPAFKIGADLSSAIDEDVISRIFGVV